MARPQKNNADYFSHDNDMRNDEKILAIRNEFGAEGYSIWCMLLEKLCKAEFFELPYSDKEVKLWAGDFRLDFKRLKLILDYFIDIDLLQKNENKIFSNELKLRFSGLLAKRTRDKDSFQQRKQTKKEVSVSEKPQSKVKYSKVNKSKDNNKPPTPFKKEFDLSFIDRKDFKDLFSRWMQYRREVKKPYKSKMSVQSAYKDLLKLSNTDLSVAKNIVEQSICRQWQGLFALKEDFKNKNNEVGYAKPVENKYPS